MKIIVTKNLNVRAGAPSVNAPCFQYLAPGSEIEVDGKLYKGDKYDDIDTWLKDVAGNYYWSGGVLFAPEDKRDAADPLFSLVNYNRSVVNIPDEWRFTYGKGINVAVLDTGINDTHRDFNGVFNSENILDFTTSHGGTKDLFNHGTHIAGIIGARSLRSKGIRGIAPECNLFILKVGEDDGDFLPGNIINALKWVSENDIQLVNMSFSVNFKRFNKIVPQLDSMRNCLMIAAAGENELLTKSNFFYPAMHPGVISVGAVSNAYSGDFNTQLDYNIPLIPMTSCSGSGPDKYKTESGSSMAAAVLTGIIALYLSFSKTGDFQKDAIKKELDKYSFSNRQILDSNKLMILKP